MTVYAGIWRRTALIPPTHLHPGSLVSLTEAAALLGVTRRTLQRAIRRGDGPVPEPQDRYVGRATWFRVIDLMVWRARVISEGPTSEPEAWQCWMAITPFTVAELRPSPDLRPTWWPRGERRYRAKRRVTTELESRLAALDGAMRLANTGTPLGDQAFGQLCHDLHRPSPERA